MEVSQDGSDWTLAATGFFPDGVPEHNCEETRLFPTTDAQAVSFRYAKFVAVSYYEIGAAISYFGPNEIGAQAIMGFLLDLPTYSYF